MTKIGAMVKKARKDRRLTIRDACAMLRVSPGHLHAIETGKIERPKMDVIYKLAAYYNLPSDDVCLAATRIPQDCFYKIIRCPALIEVIRNFPE